MADRYSNGEPIEHPVPCEDCGSTFWPDWTLLPHALFNEVCPGGNGYLCFPCFANRATAMWFQRALERIAQEAEDNADDEYDAEGHEADLRWMVPIDLGDGHHAAGWTPTGDLYWLHRCDGDSYRGPYPWRWAVGTIDVTSGTKHELRKRLPIYVGGSILCGACGDHGFINDGKWVKA